MTDLISRRAAIKAIDDLPNCYNGYSDTYDKAYIIGVLEEVPPIEPKHGKWIIEYDSWGGLFKTVRAHKCSICKHYLDFDGVNAGRGDANYCPNCGALMERSEDE